MTANNIITRWIAQWFMRFEAAGNMLRIMLFGGTFLTTGLSALAEYGYGGYAPQFVAAVVIGTTAFAWYNHEGGILNQKNRDRMDAGQNFAGPEQLIDDILIGVSHFAANNGRPPNDKEYEAIKQAVARPWSEFRDGVDIDEIVDGQQTLNPGMAIADGGVSVIECGECGGAATESTHKGDRTAECGDCGRMLCRFTEGETK